MTDRSEELRLEKLLGETAGPFCVTAIEEIVWRTPSICDSIWALLLDPARRKLVHVSKEALEVLCDATTSKLIHLVQAMRILWQECKSDIKQVELVSIVIDELAGTATDAINDILEEAWSFLEKGEPLGIKLFSACKTLESLMDVSEENIEVLWALASDCADVKDLVVRFMLTEGANFPQEPLTVTCERHVGIVTQLTQVHWELLHHFSVPSLWQCIDGKIEHCDLVAKISNSVKKANLPLPSSCHPVLRAMIDPQCQSLPDAVVLEFLGEYCGDFPELLSMTIRQTKINERINSPSVGLSFALLHVFPEERAMCREIALKSITKADNVKDIETSLHILFEVVEDLSDVFELFCSLLPKRHLFDRKILNRCWLRMCEKQLESQPSSKATHLNRLVTLSLENILVVECAMNEEESIIDLLRQLSSKFDLYLAQPDIVELLFTFAYYQNREVIQLSLDCISRLVDCNPAFVKGRLQVLIEQQTSVILEEDSFGSIVFAVNRLQALVCGGITPNGWGNIENSITHKLLGTSSNRMIVSVLNLLKEAFRQQLLGIDKVIEVVSLIMGHSFKHDSLVVRKAALALLSSLIFLYPEILKKMGNLVEECMKAIAKRHKRIEEQNIISSVLVQLVGDLDPATRTAKVAEGTPLTTLIDELRPEKRWKPSLDQRSGSIGIGFLFRLFSGASSEQQQKSILDRLPRILCCIPQSEASLLVPKLYPCLLWFLSNPQHRQFHETVLRVFKTTIISLKKSSHLVPQLLSELNTFSNNTFSSVACTGELLELIKAISENFQQETRPHCGWIAKFLLKCLWQLGHSTKHLTQAVLVLVSVSYLLDSQIHVIVPAMIPLITPSRTPDNRELATAAIHFLFAVVNHQPVKNHSSSIFQRVAEFIETLPEENNNAVAFKLLGALLQITGRVGLEHFGSLKKISEVSSHGKELLQIIAYHQENGTFPEKKVKVPKPDITADEVNHSRTVISFGYKVGNVNSILHLYDHIANMTNCHTEDIDCLQTPTQTHELQFWVKGEHRLSPKFGESVVVLKSGPEKESLARVQPFNIIRSPSRLSSEHDWVGWLQQLTKILLVCGRCNALKILRPFLGISAPVDRDLLTYLLIFQINGCSGTLRSAMIQNIEKVVGTVSAPMFAKQLCFSIFEYFEPERLSASRHRTVSVTRTITVTRQSPEAKFGIIYDQEGANIVVTRLAPNGEGERAKVPVGAVLLDIDGYEPRTVNEIPSLIRGKLKVRLKLRTVEAATSEDVILPPSSFLAEKASDAKLHEKSIYFEERHVDILTRSGASTASALGEIVSHLHSLGMTWEATSFSRLVVNLSAPDSNAAAKRLGLLHKWDELKNYHMTNMSTSVEEHKTGLIQCLSAQQDLRGVVSNSMQFWEQLSSTHKETIARVASQAAFVLRDWKSLKTIVDDVATDALDPISYTGYLFHTGEVRRANTYVASCIRHLTSELSDVAKYGYSNGTNTIVGLERLKHLDEVLSYPSLGMKHQNQLKLHWEYQLENASPDSNNFLMMLSISSLVVPSSQQGNFHKIFFSKCETNHWEKLIDIVVSQLVGEDPTVEELAQKDNCITLAYLRRLFTRKKSTAIQLLTSLIEQEPTNEHQASRCQELAEWTEPDDRDKALRLLTEAAACDNATADVWQQLAEMHYKLIDISSNHIRSAVEAFAKALVLCEPDYAIRNSLRLMSLWFTYGHAKAMIEVMKSCLAIIPLQNWLKVTPQLFARVGIPSQESREMLLSLLARIGKNFPHAIVFPTVVCERSSSHFRKRAGSRLMDELKQESSIRVILQEAFTLSTELVRVAVLWQEKWLAKIHEAAKKHDSMERVQQILLPLFEETENPVTPNEKAFDSEFGQALRRAKDSLMSQQCDRAWSILKKIYSQLSSNVKSTHVLDMSEVSPTLSNTRQSRIVVPGTFSVEGTQIFIEKFDSAIAVIASKQKPRRFALIGSDGQAYRFLLKGNEDLRQDERVMQVLEFVNTFLSQTQMTRSNLLSIVTYNVLPLSSDVGICGWVENCNTMYKLLEQRRATYSISIMEECNMIVSQGGLRRIDEYHSLPKQTRMQLLQNVFQRTNDDEFQLILLDLSASSEQWIQQRRMYSNSLATMSMLGYVIGLGDRHLNNIMCRNTGTVVHIDFGDCFEVAMHRNSYAEAVPFRLTRLLVRALGIGGAAGVFTIVCEHVLGMMREFKESLQSILEAFVYDPLINWRQTVDNTNEPAEVEASDHKEWAELVEFIHDRAPFENAPAPSLSVPQNVTVKYIVTQVKAAVRKQNFNEAIAWINEAKERFPMLGETHLDNDTQSLQSVCLHHSVAEKRNRDATQAILRVEAKLIGKDFGGGQLTVSEQASRLITEATSLSNLAEAYITGWAPFW